MSVWGVFLFVTLELGFIEIKEETRKVERFFFQRSDLGNGFANLGFT